MRLIPQGATCWAVLTAVSSGLAFAQPSGLDQPPIDVEPTERGTPVEGGVLRDSAGRPITPSSGQLQRRRGALMSSLTVDYQDRWPRRQNLHPSPAAIAELEVFLAIRNGMIVAPREAPAGSPTFRAPLSEVGTKGTAISEGALQAMGGVIQAWLLEQGFVGLVTPAIPPGAEIEPKDIRLDVAIDTGPHSVGSIEVTYELEHPNHPAIADLLSEEVLLSRAPSGVEAGWIAADPRYESLRLETRRVALRDLPRLDNPRFYFSALLAINSQLRDALLRRGLIGVLVITSPEDFSVPNANDIRGGEDQLRIQIKTGVVDQIRSLAFGDRFSREDRENNPRHARILDRSPLRPDDGQSERTDLLRRDELDAYLLRLNRFTGRRVDAAISPSESEGKALLDFLIAERQPVLAYAQVSNTGTEATDEIRYRAGANITQLANTDDVLTLDYITAGFDASQAVLGGYESRLFGLDRWRWRADATYSEFTASDVGLAGNDFDGESYSVGGEIIWNFYQNNDLFIDAFAGVRFQHVFVENPGFFIEAESDFFLPRLGLRVERDRKTTKTFGSVWVEANLPDVGGTESLAELGLLGRLDVDDDWVVAKWDISHSFYLEPVLNRASWSDLQRPSSSTLAHEVVLSTRGQYAPEHRLIPQEQQVAGGLFTVRGYPESVIAGDSVYIGSAEYRFHLPKAYTYSESAGELFGEPFRWRPQEPFGEADWDLVFKGFVDVARTENTDALFFEEDETLVGVGVGVELSVLSRFIARVDLGFALEDTTDGEVKSGDNEVHFTVTALF